MNKPQFFSDCLWVDGGMKNLTDKVYTKMLKTRNAGGSSLCSEALSCLYLHQLLNFDSVKTEMEIKYKYFGSKMCDYIVTKQTKKGRESIGVSVTRAMGWPNESFFDEKQGKELLRKKLDGLIIARDSVDDENNFQHSILHILCQSLRIKNLLKKAYRTLPLYFQDSITVLCTVCLPSPGETLCFQGQEIFENVYKNKNYISYFQK